MVIMGLLHAGIRRVWGDGTNLVIGETKPFFHNPPPKEWISEK